MKTSKLLTAALVAAMVFTACSQDDDVVTNDPNVVDFKVSIDGLLETRAIIDESTGEGSFENRDTWGIFGKTENPLSWPLNNKLFTLGTTVLYWDDISMTAPVTFTAYYPTSSSISDAAAYKFNVVTATNPDLLLAGPVTASKGEPVALNFRHAMCKLEFNLFKDGSVPGELQDSQLTLLNMKSIAHVNLLDGTVDAAAAEGNDAYPRKTVFNDFFVAPQDLTPGADWLKVELAGNTYILKVPDNLNPGSTTNPTRLESGKKLTVDITFKLNSTTEKTVVSMATSQISEWANQGRVDADAIKN